MTPQLQQAIKLLQLSNLELAEFVEQQLEENPFLDRTAENAADGASEPGAERQDAPAEEGVAALDLSRDDAHERAAEAIDAPGDDRDRGGEPEPQGQDYRVNEWASVGAGRGSLDDDREFGETLARDISLWDHLTEQLHVATRDPLALFIGAYLIDLIDDAGYLREATADIAARIGAEAADVEATLTLIQGFDPAGVGARDLKECLRLQLRARQEG